MAMTSCTIKGTFFNGKMPCIPSFAAFSPNLLFSAIRHSHNRTSPPTSSTRQTLGGRSWLTIGTKQTSLQRLPSWRISLRGTNISSATTRFQRENYGVFSKPSFVLFPRPPKTPHVLNGCLAFNRHLNLSMSTWTITYGLSITCLQCKLKNLKSLFSLAFFTLSTSLALKQNVTLLINGGDARGPLTILLLTSGMPSKTAVGEIRTPRHGDGHARTTPVYCG